MHEQIWTQEKSREIYKGKKIPNPTLANLIELQKSTPEMTDLCKSTLRWIGEGKWEKGGICNLPGRESEAEENQE